MNILLSCQCLGKTIREIYVQSNRFSANRETRNGRNGYLVRSLKSMPFSNFPQPDYIFALPILFSQISLTQSLNPVP